ncbi:MAG: stage II sporulation protein D [Oscillospiraceae bacterium]|nr:stage II sporulation protein D [Oscillospiraceae bacterium]MBR3556260.1 stage II sporulation protein D [Oscillospiraceae bacterium]
MKELRDFLRLGACTVLPLVLFALILARLHPQPADPEPEAPPPTAILRETDAPEADASPEPEEPSLLSPDGERWVKLITPEGVLELSMAEYLPGVVAAEMPAAFPAEALKAQAVAARTDTVWRQLGHSPHPDGACCSDPGCCKAWLSREELKARWGEEYDHWAAAVREAVTATDGQVLLYGGEPIFAAFHACSPGSTEASENVWMEALPYLRSVSSPETADTVPNFTSAVTLSYLELRRTAAEKYPGLQLTGPGETWLTEAQYSESGRLLTVKLGDTALTGTQLRFLLGLRSAAVTWTCGEEEIRFQARGSGHGVGMSQYGARQMALEGADCWTILAHYYPGAIPGEMPAQP